MVYTFESPATLAVASRLVDSGKVILQRPMTWRGRGVLVRRRLVRHVIIRVVNELLFQIYYRLFLQRGDEVPLHARAPWLLLRSRAIVRCRRRRLAASLAGEQ